jgi:hypothetical protein
MVINRSRHRRLSPPVALLAEVLKLVEYRDHTAATLFVAWRKDRRNRGLDRRVPPLKSLKKDISDEAIRMLANVGRLPQTADLNEFGRDIRSGIQGYLSSRETPPRQEKREIWNLVAAVESGNQSKLESAIQRLSSDVRRKFDRFDDQTLDQFGPNGSLERWHALLQRAIVTERRSRRTSRRGRIAERTPIQWYGFAPPQRGNPVRAWELSLTAFIINAWQEAAGQKAPNVVNRGRDRRPSAVVALLAEVLKIIDYRDHTAATLFAAWRSQFEPMATR